MRDSISLIIVVPLAAIGGIACLWIGLEIEQTLNEPMLAFAFVFLAAFFFLTALVLGAVATWDVLRD